MSFDEFKSYILEEIQKYVKENNRQDIKLDDSQINDLYIYMKELIEWNEKINLTAIIEPKEVVVKHFIDSLTSLEYVGVDDSIIDVGTGGGFPGNILAIGLKNGNNKITLLDSLNKRIIFLDQMIEQLKLNNVNTIHGRAEDYGQDINYREKYSIAISRAVAPLNVLLEYLSAFVKVGGRVICMKGPNIVNELADANKAISKLGLELEKEDNFTLEGNERNIIVFKKVKKLEKIYPRKAGLPSKNPIK